MITTILAGGEEGVEQAALDVAIRLNLEFGGRTATVLPEDEARIKKYNLTSIASQNLVEAMKQNIGEADGTLIIAKGKLSAGPEQAEKIVKNLYKPYLRLDMGVMSMPYACRLLKQWSISNWVKVLYVTGPKQAEDPEIYELTVKVLEAVFKKG